MTFVFACYTLTLFVQGFMYTLSMAIIPAYYKQMEY